MGLHFLAFFLFLGRLLGPPHKLPKTVRFPKAPYKEFSSARPGSILQFFAFWAFVSFHFGLVGLHFLSFWYCGPSFPCGLSFPSVLALWDLISLHFGLLGFYFLAFRSFGGPLLGPPPPTSCQKRSVVPRSNTKNLAAPGPAPFCNLWPSGPSFPFILALWTFISFDFGLVGLHFLAFWPFGLLFPCISAFWASASGAPPTNCQK